MALAVMTIDPDAQPDMTGEEIRDAILAMDDNTRIIVISRPTSGKHKCFSMHRGGDGKLEIEYDDEAET